MIKRKKPLFLRLGYTQYSKLGLRRKNKLKYRKAKGIDNKVRLKMKGHLRNVSIGFRTKKENRGMIRGHVPLIVNNLEEIKKIKKDSIVIVGHIGNKKRKEILEYAIKNNIGIFNLNPKKTLQVIENDLKLRKEARTNKKERISEGNKRAKDAEKKKEEEEKKAKEKESEKENKETKLEDSVKMHDAETSVNSEDKK
jgi:large subunit ribosomal protein L32e